MPLDNHPMTIYGGVRLDAEGGVGCIAESVTATDLRPSGGTMWIASSIRDGALFWAIEFT
jgi:hypothetical protein